ncbi:MAG: anthranilate synthase component I [Actinomycetaceae bacterium]|nr:anthranilate synthase component I [Actinomycetaceae bacterium]
MTPVNASPGPQHLELGEIWPSRDHFLELARTRRVIPVVEKLLLDDAAPLGIYRRLACGSGTFILESAEHDGTWGRWSFIGVRSVAQLVATRGRAEWKGEVPVGLAPSGTTTQLLASALEELEGAAIEGLPPLTGGLVGALGWDTLFDWEPRLRRRAPRELDTPDSVMCLTTDLVAVDHRDGTVWLIANAINANNLASGAAEAYEDAVARLAAMESGLQSAESMHALRRGEAAESQPQLRTPQPEFEAAVRAGKEAIRDGEVFQVVLSQRADIDCPADALDVYRVLRTINPSPYMYCLRLDDGAGGDFAVVGSSPETLMRLDNGHLTSFPIAGSRPRGADWEEDQHLAQELLADPKELSEHVMLVDLARNDLAKVCVPGTVEVQELMEVKRFSHIMHISSTVSGRLAPGYNSVDCLRATFPAGTLSGAPKPRAIEIIDALEPARRGIYGGVIGYFDFCGNADLAIAIRTAVLAAGKASVQAGAGIVADSVPQTEFVETRNKAAAAVRAIQIAGALRPVGG